MKLAFALLVLAGAATVAACSPETAAAPAMDSAQAVGAKTIAPGYAVKGQITKADLTAIAAAGFGTVINNRPDGEEAGQPSSAELAAEAARLGLSYHYIPVAHEGPSTQNAAALAQAMLHAKGPVLAFCRSGRRAEALRTMNAGD